MSSSRGFDYSKDTHNVRNAPIHNLEETDICSKESTVLSSTSTTGSSYDPIPEIEQTIERKLLKDTRSTHFNSFHGQFNQYHQSNECNDLTEEDYYFTSRLLYNSDSRNKSNFCANGVIDSFACIWRALSVVGVIFLLFVRFLIQSQPFYVLGNLIKEGDDVVIRTQANAMNAAKAYGLSFLLCTLYLDTKEARRKLSVWWNHKYSSFLPMRCSREEEYSLLSKKQGHKYYGSFGVNLAKPSLAGVEKLKDTEPAKENWDDTIHSITDIPSPNMELWRRRRHLHKVGSEEFDKKVDGNMVITPINYGKKVKSKRY